MLGTTGIGKVALLASALGLAPALAGCGTSIADVCDEMCDCEGCSDDEYDECVDEGEAIEEWAEDLGCGSEFDDYVDCVADNAYCDGDDFEIDEDCEDEMGDCRIVEYD